MARKAPAPAAKTAKKRPARKRTSSPKAAPKAAAASAFTGFKAPQMPEFPDMGKMAKMMTPEQAIDLYKANAKIALDVINAAIENTARLRKKQFEAEEEARAFQKKHARNVGRSEGCAVADGRFAGRRAGGHGEVDALLGRDVRADRRDAEATVLADRGADVRRPRRQGGEGGDGDDAGPAADAERRSAMQGVVSSGGSAFETMQRVMGDFAKLAQGSMPGMRR